MDSYSPSAESFSLDGTNGILETSLNTKHIHLVKSDFIIAQYHNICITRLYIKTVVTTLAKNTWKICKKKKNKIMNQTQETKKNDTMHINVKQTASAP